MFAVAILIAAVALAAEIPPVIPNVSCKETADCLSFSKRLPLSPSKLITSGYSCLNNKCVYMLSPGSECQKPSQCSYYSFLGDLLSKNKTELLPGGVTLQDLPNMMDNVCSPSACSVASSCNLNYKVLFEEETGSCCDGVGMGDKCEQRLDQLSVCGVNSICVPTGVCGGDRPVPKELVANDKNNLYYEKLYQSSLKYRL
jgi:hypothetical protein